MMPGSSLSTVLQKSLKPWTLCGLCRIHTAVMNNMGEIRVKQFYSSVNLQANVPSEKNLHAQNFPHLYSLCGVSMPVQRYMSVKSLYRSKESSNTQNKNSVRSIDPNAQVQVFDENDLFLGIMIRIDCEKLAREKRKAIIIMDEKSSSKSMPSLKLISKEEAALLKTQNKKSKIKEVNLTNKTNENDWNRLVQNVKDHLGKGVSVQVTIKPKKRNSEETAGELRASFAKLSKDLEGYGMATNKVTIDEEKPTSLKIVYNPLKQKND